MSASSPDFNSISKKLKSKRNRLLVGSAIFFVLALLAFILSRVTQVDFDTFYAMVISDPVQLSLELKPIGLLNDMNRDIVSASFSSVTGTLVSSLKYVAYPLLTLATIIYVLYSFKAGDTDNLFFALPMFAIIITCINIIASDDSLRPEQKTVVEETRDLILEGKVDELLLVLTRNNPRAGQILKDVMEKGIITKDAVRDLKDSMRSGHLYGDFKAAAEFSLALTQSLVVQAHNKPEAREKSLDSASWVAGLNVKLLNEGVSIEKRLGYRIFELAQRKNPGLTNPYIRIVENQILTGEKQSRLFYHVMLMLVFCGALLVVFSGFANNNLRTITRLKSEN